MAPNPQTLHLDVSAHEFTRITLAMMIQSNNLLKLQGFGICLASWINECEHDTFNLEIAAKAISSFEVLPDKRTKVWVSVTLENLAKLRDLRDYLELRIKEPITLAAAIFAVVEAFCLANG